MILYRTAFTASCIAASLALLAPAAASAQDGKDNGDFVTAGIGPGILPDYEGSNDYRVLPVPGAVGSIKGHGFVYVGNQFSVDLIPDKGGPGWDFQFGPNLSVGFNRSGSGSVHDARVKALHTVGTAVTVGGYVGIAKQGVITSDFDRFSFTLGVDHDIAGAYDGTTVTPSLNYLTPLSKKAMIVVAARAVYADRRYADAYFSVTPADSAASGLPVFTARSGWKNWSLAAAANYSLTGDLTHGLSTIGGIMYTRLINDFAASPVTSIAGSRDQWMAGLGLAYTF